MARTEGGRSGDRALVYLHGWVRRRGSPACLLASMVAAWIATFVVLGWIRHARYATYGYDLGIYDQGIWLLSHFRSFVTVRGLPVLGNHANLVLLLFVPFYWLRAGPEFLLVVQVAAQGSGAIAVYLLARDRLGERWLGLLAAAALLLNPTYQYLTWEFFHLDALAAAALLFAAWAASAKRWRWFAVAGVVAAACRKDAALAMAGLGILVTIRGERRIGLATLLASAAWYGLATRLVIPLALGGHAPFYEGLFPELGSNAAEVMRNLVLRPNVVARLATAHDRLSYDGLWAGAALLTTILWGASPISTQYHSGIWPLGARPLTAVKDRAAAMPPPSARVSATYTFVPHLTHRDEIYQFPEPWYVFAWGINGAGLPEASRVEWLVVDRRDLLSDRERRQVEFLLSSGQFETRSDTDGVVVAQRVR